MIVVKRTDFFNPSALQYLTTLHRATKSRVNPIIGRTNLWKCYINVNNESRGILTSLSVEDLPRGCDCA